MSLVAQPVMEAAAASHAGHLRRVNQDAWGYSAGRGVFVVCDGMGGAVGGEIASQLAADAFLEHLSPLVEEKRSARMVTHAVHAANSRVYARASAEPALRGMGTTLVGLALRGSAHAVVAHVGDSRCYRLRHGELIACTQDHSLVAEQVRLGALSQEQALTAPLQHVITRALGTRRSVGAEVHLLDVEAGDLFLLCTDGLTRELPEAAIAVILRRPSATLGARAEALVQAALSAGGRDNITCLLAAPHRGHGPLP